MESLLDRCGAGQYLAPHRGSPPDQPTGRLRRLWERSRRSGYGAPRGWGSPTPNAVAHCQGTPFRGTSGQEKGLVVHRDSCRNLAELREQPDRLISLHWEEEYRARISRQRVRVQAENRRGMIALLATRLSAIGLNIDRIATQNKDVEFTFVDLELQVTSRTHLARVMKRLRTVDGVLKVVRSARR